MYTCSRCGGTMSIPHDRCPHCGVILSGVRCDNCRYVGARSEFVSNGHRCPKCGSVVSGTGSGSGGDAAGPVGCMVILAIVVAAIFIYNRYEESKKIKENIEVSSFTDPRSGDSYFTASIFSQEWMTENLTTSRFSNGDPIPEAKSEKEWIKAGEAGKPAWCYHPNDTTDSASCGKLYNWFAFTDPRGICPEGWHTPTTQDWDLLMAQLGGAAKAGRLMKSGESWARGSRGNNKSKFSGLPCGIRTGTDGLFSSRDSVGYWWSRDPVYDNPSSGFGNSYSLTMYSKELSQGQEPKSNGLTIRCLRINQWP